jgi:Ni,Fe-hydrogenase I cytochrome b subunit
MSLQTWQETIASQIAAGTLLNTYTTAKSVINPTALVTLPANYLQPGKQFRITVLGGISNVVTAQPTFTFQVMMGSIVVHTSGAILTTTTAHTLIPFKYVVDMRVDSIGNGTNAKFLAQGVLEGIMFVISGAVADPTAGIGKIMAPNTASAVGNGFDSTIANILDFWVGISVSNAGNGIQIFQYYVEALN